MLSKDCPVSPVLSVTLVYCGQTVGWIKMKLGMEAGLGLSHIVLDGDSARHQKRGTPPIFRLRLLWPNSWMDQDATWYVGRPRPRPQCVKWGPSTQKSTAPNSRLMSVVAKRLDG